MDTLLKKYWKYLPNRLIVGWMVVVLLPFFCMWYDHIFIWEFDQPQINSFFAATLMLGITLVVLDKIAQSPGQRSLIYILPTMLLSIFALGAFFFLFRWGYSVYFLLINVVLLLLFCFVSIGIQKHIHIQKLAFIPLGRCKSFDTTIHGVNWIKLDEPELPNNDIDAIVVDLSSSELSETWQTFLTNQTLSGMPVYNNLQIFESLTGRSPIQHLYENNLGSLLPSQSYLYFKQFFETLIVLASLPVVLPVMLITFLIVRLESSGNAIFVQDRVGQGGRLFRMYKFRSMVVDAEKDGAKLAQENDTRITRFGHIMRKTRLDELPQIWNVLKGDMSLIGPRPEQKVFVEQFQKNIPFYSYRHIVKPGMTGWAQVTQGYAGDTDATIEKIQRDFYYIKHFSFTLDLMIVIKTAQTIFTGFGAR